MIEVLRKIWCFAGEEDVYKRQVLYVKGLSLSHRAAYNTLKNLRASLQGKLERQPLGVIQEKGVGALKKMFIDDIDSIELQMCIRDSFIGGGGDCEVIVIVCDSSTIRFLHELHHAHGGRAFPVSYTHLSL